MAKGYVFTEIGEYPIQNGSQGSTGSASVVLVAGGGGMTVGYYTFNKSFVPFEDGVMVPNKQYVVVHGEDIKMIAQVTAVSGTGLEVLVAART